MPETLTREVTISLRIENTYEDGDEVVVYETTTIPEPPTLDEGSEAWDDWAYDHIHSLTGTGREDGDAWYDVEVIESTMPELMGRTFQWGY